MTEDIKEYKKNILPKNTDECRENILPKNTDEYQENILPDKVNISSKRKIPKILLRIKKYLEMNSPKLYSENDDGRINSTISEKIVLELLHKKYKDLIHIPKIRSWYDLLVKKDDVWLPVNVKITTTKTSDNVGNLAPCLYAYTDYQMRLHKNYNNGHLSKY